MQNTSPKIHIVYLTVIAVLLIVLAGGALYFHRKMERMQMASATAGQMKRPGAPGQGGMPGMSMTMVSPPPESDQQMQQIMAATASAKVAQDTFNITGGNFYFVPNKIVVHKGDQVTFVMTNAGGTHDLVIDELGVKTPITHTAEAATVTFTASKVGSFVYYCDVPGHREKGMWGTIVVE